jgi:transcriptional regulator with XRE-family HTH domain
MVTNLRPGAPRLNYLRGNGSTYSRSLGFRSMDTNCGPLLRRWRDLRKLSQLELAEHAGVSSRHLSFIESGRSQPSRQMLLTLADALEVPLRERNQLLTAAGFAPVYSQRALDSPEVAAVLKSIELVLERMDPFPCVVMNHLWEVQRANQAAMRLIAHFVPPEEIEQPLNLVKLLFSPAMRATVENFEQIAPAFAQQLHRETLAGDEEAKALLDQVLKQPGVPESWRRVELGAHLSPVVPLVLRKGELRLSLFTTLATLGTPLDVTLQELRIETYLPADEATARALEILGAHRPPGR